MLSVFLFVKQKTADEMRISDWSSDVCSSDLVTRWFGGVLLGAGGLVRAYGDAVRAGLEESGTRRRRLVIELLVEVSHAEAGRLETELRQRGVTVLETTYAANVTFLLGVPAGCAGDLEGLLGEPTAGAAGPLEVGRSERRRAGKEWFGTGRSGV